MTPKSKVPVTERALLQRLNRKLAGEGLRLKRPRTARDLQNLGDYFLLNVSGNWVAGKDIDLEEMGREYDVLKPWEIVRNA